jgi:hypothetical protein
VLSSILIFLLCMAILLPTFCSKIFVKQKNRGLRTSQWRRAWRNYDESSSKRRSVVGSTEASSSRDFIRRTTTPASQAHQSSVAAIRARVAEKTLQESTTVSSSRMKASKQ